MFLKRVVKTTKIIIGIALLIGIGGAMKELIHRGSLLRNANIERNVKDATVEIGACPYKESCGGGTGFVIAQSEHGAFIITNKHVCVVARMREEDRNKNDNSVYAAVFMTVVRKDDKRAPGQIIKVSQNADLCMVYTPMKFKHILPIAKSYKVGEVVSSYGFPQGGPIYLHGVIKKHDAFWLGIYNESNMLAWYGISGSAVTNANGEVVGVMSNLLSNEVKVKDRSKVYGSLFVPLELLQEFVTGVVR